MTACAASDLHAKVPASAFQTHRPSIPRLLHPNLRGQGPVDSDIARLQRTHLYLEFQSAFEGATGLPLVLRAYDALPTPLQGSLRANPFCVLMAGNNGTCSACLRLQQNVEAAAQTQPATLECHAGLIESAVPVHFGAELVGYLQTGQIFFRPKRVARLRRGLLALNVTLPPDLQCLAEAAYLHTRIVPKESYVSILRLLQVFADHLGLAGPLALLTDVTTDPPSITRARAFIAARMNDELHLDEVAAAVHMSRCHFCKVFKRATGFTLNQYLVRLRVQSAKQRLLDPHLRISEAAFATGFQSLSQFNRMFRRIAGESPTTYRRRYLRASPGGIVAQIGRPVLALRKA
ncbi:MAG: helix-turn-helix domain-containing protein [Opitutaceae bacterium]